MIDGKLLHADPCALHFKQRGDQETQRQLGRRMITTWAVKQFQDERGVVVHEKTCRCPDCQEWNYESEVPPVDGEEIIEEI